MTAADLPTDADPLAPLLRDRPLPLPPPDLAAVAIRRARLAAAARARRWSAVLTVVAAVIAVPLVAVLVLHARLVAGGFSNWSGLNATAVASSSSPSWGLVGVVLLLAAVVTVTAQAAVADGRRW